MLLKILRKLIRKESAIHYIGGSDVLPPPLKGQQEQTALEALEQGDPAAKQLLVEHNLRLVVYISRRFENTGIHLEDLISIGTIGLMKAIDTYRLDKKIKLYPYLLAIVNNAEATLVCRCHLSLVFPILWGYTLGVQLLGHTVTI